MLPAAARSIRRTARSKRRPSCRSARRRPVKGLTIDQVRATGAQMILGNTYHLALRPGEEIVRAARRPAPLHGLGRADPDRQRRLSALQPGAERPRSPSRRPCFARTSTAACSSFRRSGRSQIQEALGSDVAMVLDHVRRPAGRRCRHSRRLRADDPLGGPLPGRGPPAGPGPVRHRARGPECRPAGLVRRAAGRAGLSRLRGRRLERGRNAGRDVSHARCHLPRAARRASRAI